MTTNPNAAAIERADKTLRLQNAITLIEIALTRGADDPNAAARALINDWVAVGMASTRTNHIALVVTIEDETATGLVADGSAAILRQWCDAAARRIDKLQQAGAA